MARHSKWANIKHRKGAADSKRAGLFTKLTRAITVAAREGGGDEQFNIRLRLAVEKARESGMPKDVIERAVTRGVGGEKDGVQVFHEIYEGYGPHGVAYVVEAVTDNKNRTVADLRHAFSRSGGALGVSGSVKWMFAYEGEVAFSGLDEIVQLSLLDVGATDIVLEDGEYIAVTSPDKLMQVREAVVNAGGEVVRAQLGWFAVNKKDITQEQWQDIEKFEQILDDMDDVESFVGAYT